MIATLTTERLVLRDWCDDDLEPFAALNADPTVMEHLPSAMSRPESDETAERIRRGLRERGWGLWAVEAPSLASFCGFVGLQSPTFEAAFTPCVEVGWRLARAYWGRGFATEAARAALGFGFGRLGLSEVVSMTVPSNLRSQRVMQRLGMTRNAADDFDHPRLPEGHRLRRHVLYRISRPGAAPA
jgi:RimJ/RimL family protein N-acetyltransferase